MGEKNVNVSVGRKEAPAHRALQVLCRKFSAPSESGFLMQCFLRYCEKIGIYDPDKGWNTQRIEKLEKKYPAKPRGKLPDNIDDDLKD